MFNHVVRINVIMTDGEAEPALDTFTAHGWPARVLVGKAPLVEVDVGVTGARFRSVSHAADLLRRECARVGLSVTVRAAWLVHQSSPALREYVVFRSRSSVAGPTRRRDKIGSIMRKVLVRLGLSDTGAMIYAPTLSEARDDLRRRRSEIDPVPRPGRPLAIRRPLRTPTDDTTSEAALSDDLRLRTGVIASMTALFLLGSYIGEGDRPPWWGSLLIVGAGGPAVALTTWHWVGTLPARRQSTGAAALSPGMGVIFAAGFFHGHYTGADSVRRALLFAAALGLGLGAWYLLRSPLRRTAAWLLPVALSLSVPSAAMLGRISYGAYLEEFDLSIDAVDRDTFVYVVAALEPAALILLSALVVLGIAGWTTYFFIEGSAFLGVMAIAVTSLYGITSAIDAGRVGAERAMAAARAREDVPGFFGIEPSWVCARPVSGSVPTLGGQLPTDRSILWLGDSGDRAALWDPVQGNTIRLALSDVALLEVPANTATCPR